MKSFLCLPLDELASCLECDGLIGGLCDDSPSSGTVRRSASAPQPPTLDPVSSVASCDSQSKYHCDLVARNGSDVYRYPSPLHAVAIQSPVFLQMLGHGSHSRDEGLLKSIEAGVEGLKPESSLLSVSVSAPVVTQSSSWSAPSSSFSQTPSHKRLDCYIYSLLQRRALPVRTSRPRTSISTDLSKSILRQASLCVRQVSGPVSGSGLGNLRGSELKPSWLAGGASLESAATLSPQRQWSVESKSEEQETPNVYPDGSNDMVQHGFKNNNTDLDQNQSSSPLTNGIQNGSSFTTKDINASTNSLLKKKSKRLLPSSTVTTATLPKDCRELGSPKANSLPKVTKQPCYLPDQERLLKSPPVVKTQTASPKDSPKPLQTGWTEKADRSVQERCSLGSSSQSQDEARGEGEVSHMVNAKYIPAQRPNIKLRRGSSKNVKTVKVKTTVTLKTSRASEHESLLHTRGVQSHRMSSSKKSRLTEDGGSVHVKVSTRAAGGGSVRGVSSSRIKRLPASIPEGRVVDKDTTSTVSNVLSGSSRFHHHGNHIHNSDNHHYHGHYHYHGRDQVVVVAKPKYKRNDYRRLRAIM